MARKIADELFIKTEDPDAGFDAEQMVLFFAEASRTEYMLGEKRLGASAAKRLQIALERRIKGEPLQYILGEWEFYSLPFFIGAGVLIPRADTELLVDSALEFLNGKRDMKVIDLCSGSGCIAIAVEKNAPGNKVFALEKYDAALEYLKKNAIRNSSDIEIIKADVLDSARGNYDLILSNPPYIKNEVKKELSKEVLNEPETALFGGEDGCDFYRSILKNWAPRLNPGGRLMFEIGFDQKDVVMALMAEAGLKNITPKKDINGLWRVIIGT